MIVLIAVQEKQVVITDQFATTPITGRQAIFARVTANAPTETRYHVEIVGCYTTLDIAARARENHAKQHPGRKYIQKVATLDDAETWQPPAPPTCIRCHTQIVQGSYCPPCHKTYLDETRAVDPLGAAPDDVPVTPTSVGQGPATLVLAPGAQ